MSARARFLEPSVYKAQMIPKIEQAHNCRPSAVFVHDVSRSSRGRQCQKVYAVAAVEVKTVKIGTRGSPLALAQAYMTRDKLKVI